jgi:hypothetical protein
MDDAEDKQGNEDQGAGENADDFGDGPHAYSNLLPRAGGRENGASVP